MAKKHNFNLSRTELEMMLLRSEYKGSDKTLKWVMIFVAHYLHEQHGWGKKRIQDLIDGVKKWSKTINDGTSDGKDMQKWCDDMGLDFDELLNS
jgi:hypothetical protein